MKTIQRYAVGALLLPALGCSPAAGVEARVVPTPLERAEFERLTSHAELVEYVRELEAISPLIRVETLGTSVEGREIPLLRISSGEFGADRDRKVTVLLYAQQHGNEASGKEGALLFARDVAAGRHDALLEHMDVLLVPQVNPDGGEVHRRQNAAGVDLNRSHLILDGTEIVALRELFHRYEPEVALDIHEYQPWVGAWLEHGFVRLFDEQFGVSTNVNTPAAIRELSEAEFIPFSNRFLEERGFTAHNYIIGNPDGIRYSTTNVNDGRQGFGILATLSFIVEGRNGRTPTESIERRAEGQRAAIEALLQFVADRREDVLGAVRSARADLAEGRVTEFALTMTRETDGRPLRIPALSVAAIGEGEYEVGDTIEAVIEQYRPLVVASRVVELPSAYLVPASQAAVIELLERHRVELRRLTAGEEVEAAGYEITGWRTEELEGESRIPEVRTVTVRHVASEGDVLVPTAQLRGLLVATALEPQSMHALLQYQAFAALASTGRYPILRVGRAGE